MTPILTHPEHHRLDGHRLGKQPAKFDPRTLRLADYIDRATWSGISVPTKVLETPKLVDNPMFANDRLGDCVCAAMGHVAQMLSTLATGHEAAVSDADVIKVYEDVAGYVPGDPSTDRGTVMLDALNYWRKTGIAGHKIKGFAAFAPRDHVQWKAANYLFGNTFVGLALPISAQAEVGATWKVDSTTGDGEAGSWGGHCVPGFDFDYRAVKLRTWALDQRATWGFVGTYCDENYVVWDDTWINAVTHEAPNGFNADQLLADLAKFH